MDITREVDLQYPFPPYQYSVNGNSENFISVTPDSGYTFPSDNQTPIRLTLNSATQIASLHNSYFKFKVRARDRNNLAATNGADSQVNSIGLASVIQKFRVLVSGVVVHDSEDYGSHILNDCYSTTSLNRKTMLGDLEGYGNPDVLVTGSAWCLHMPVLSMFRIAKEFPLPICPGTGIQVELYLRSNSKNFYTASPNTDGFEVSNFSWNIPVKTPSSDYLEELRAGVVAGHSLWIPLCLVFTQSSWFSGATETEVVTTTGPCSSIQSIGYRFISADDYNNQAKDKNLISKSMGLKEWYISYGSTKLPATRNFQYSNEYPLDKETSLIRYLSALGADFADMVHLNDFNAVDNESFAIGFNWLQHSERWGNGLQLLDANAAIRTRFYTRDPVPTTTRVETIYYVDAVLEINPSQVVVHRVW
jgi:hypothetical protein